MPKFCHAVRRCVFSCRTRGKLACRRLHGHAMPLTAARHEHDCSPCLSFPLQRSCSMTPSSSRLPSTTSLSSSSSRPSSSSPRRVPPSPASRRRRLCRRRHGSPSSATTAPALQAEASPLLRSCLRPWGPCHWAAHSHIHLAGRPGAQEAGRRAAATQKGRARPCWCTW